VALMLQLILPEHAAAALDRMAGGALSTDWGPRMLTNKSKLYDPMSYNNGSVWPFLTGFLSWAEYRNHRPIAGFTHWTQNARLTGAGALGYAPELLSGDFYQPMDTAVPHQLFSSAGILTPLRKGMLGFYPDAPAKALRLEPHMPVRWAEAGFRNLRVGAGTFDFTVSQNEREAVYRIRTKNLAGHTLRLAPGFEPGARIGRVSVNGSPVRFESAKGEDVHCDLRLTMSGDDEVRVEIERGLRIVEPMDAPAIGARTSQLKILGVFYDAGSGQYRLRVEGKPGRSYTLQRTQGSPLEISFPEGEAEYIRREIPVTK